mgnify:CR=1 FL=1
MKFSVKQYEFREYIFHDIATQTRLSFNHLIKEPPVLATQKSTGSNIWLPEHPITRKTGHRLEHTTGP